MLVDDSKSLSSMVLSAALSTSDARHQCSDWNTGLGIGQTLDCDEMECRTLLVGKFDESLPNLAKHADPARAQGGLRK